MLMAFDSDVEKITIDVGVVTEGGEQLPWYEGSYSVTPRKQSIILPTKNKSMRNDVEVFQIPYTEVSNPQGGKTVTIGIE